MQPDELLTSLLSFALRSKKPKIDLGGYLRSLAPQVPDLREIEAGIRDLAFRGELAVAVEDGRLRTVTFPDFPMMALVDEYRRLEADPSLPFPSTGTLPIPLPETDVVPMEAKGYLGVLMDSASIKTPGAVKLLFPENVPSIVVPRSCFGTDLIEAAVHRISRYLQDPRNAAYVESKLLGALKGSEGPLRMALEDIVLRPRKAASTVMSPTEFSFRFWSHLSNKLVADIGAKTERTDLDQALLQSAYLVAYASFHQKGAAEREKERAADRKGLELQVKKAPFVFSAQDLFLLNDGNGATLSTKHGEGFISSFIEEATKAGDGEPLPFLVHVQAAAQKKDYFIQRDFIVPVFLKQLGDAADYLRVAYVKEWVEEIRDGRTPPICRNELPFRKDVEQRMRGQFPVISALFNAPLLRTASALPSLAPDALQDLQRCFAKADALRRPYELLGLSRSRLYREARSYLPFWQTIPVLNGIVRFLLRLFGHGANDAETPAFDPSAAAAAADAAAARISTEVAPRGEASGPSPAVTSPAPASSAPAEARAESGATRAQTEKQELERFRTAIRALIAQLVPPGDTVSRTLEELIERWNPLLEKAAKQDLVKDVNALARDFLRPVRRSLLAKPPDVRRIKALAEQLAASRSLARIGNREQLLRYLALYMLQTLLTQ